MPETAIRAGRSAPSRPSAPPAPSTEGQGSQVRRPRPSVAGAIGPTLTIGLITLAAVAGYSRVFSQSRWVAPVLVSALGVHIACWLARRRGLHPAATVVVGLAAAGLCTFWTVVPSTTTYGLPLGATWRAVGHALTQSATDFPATVAPVPATTGFVLLAAWGAGMTALLGVWAARFRTALLGAIPGIALLVICSVVGTSRGRVWAVGLVVAAVVIHLMVHTVATQSSAVWFGNRTSGATGWALGVGAGAVGAVVAATLALTSGLPEANGHGVLGWRGGGPGSGGSSRSVPSPIVDLSTRLLHLANTPVFSVRSPVASYWRLTSLDTFTGEQWESTNSYVGVSRQLPGVRPSTPGTRTVPEDFRIESLSSIWMPTAFTPEAIAGGGQVSWDPASGSLLAAKATSDGLSYHLTSLQYLSTITAAQLSHAPVPPPDTYPKRFVALPASVPRSVYALARSITTATGNEYGAALAIQNYFIDNPDFTYSLRPPSDGYGTPALTTFLFRTKVGYCQQYAGAFAVLARAVGLPTRLAVGFAVGTPQGDGSYQVRDADAHTWPEVYFGPGVGWLPFEPTKGGGFAIPGATAYTGDTARSAPYTASQVQVRPAQSPQVPVAPRPVGSRLPRDAAPAAAPVAHPRSGSLRVVAALGAAAGLVGLWLAVNFAGRRLRWWRRRRAAANSGALSGSDRVLVAWSEVAELLAWWGIRRRADETTEEFAAHASRALRTILGGHSVRDRLRSLATAATAAGYSEGPIGSEAVDAALLDAAAVQEVLGQAAPWSRHLGLLVDPRLAWRPAMVDPAPGLAGPAGAAYEQ